MRGALSAPRLRGAPSATAAPRWRRPLPRRSAANSVAASEAATADEAEAATMPSSTSTPSSIPLTSAPSSASSSNLTHLASSSAGSPLYSLPCLDRAGKWKRTLARLIDPSSSRSGGVVPIAVDIEFHSFSSSFSSQQEADEGAAAAAAATPTATEATAPGRAIATAATARSSSEDGSDKENLVYELHYVLDGRGRLSSRPLDGRGKGPRVSAGDSVASFARSAVLRPAGRAKGARRSKAPQKNASSRALPPPPPLPWWDLATLTITMPRDASAEAAQAAVRAAADKLRGARRVEGRPSTLSAEDAAAVVSGAKSRSLRGGGGWGRGPGGAAGGGGGDSGASPCCGKRRRRKKTATTTTTTKKKGARPSSPPAPSPPLPPPEESQRSGSGSKSSRAAAAATLLRHRRPLSRRLSALPAFRLKDQTNRLAVAFDPSSCGNVGFTAGIEVFLPGHVTPRHSHARGVHELFFVLSGSGVGVAQEARRESEDEGAADDGREEEEGSRKFTSLSLAPGDAALFLPMQLHAIDVPSESGSPLVCLEVMAPDDRFAERVMGEGERTGRLTDEELCALAALGCGGGGS